MACTYVALTRVDGKTATESTVAETRSSRVHVEFRVLSALIKVTLNCPRGLRDLLFVLSLVFPFLWNLMKRSNTE